MKKSKKKSGTCDVKKLVSKVADDTDYIFSKDRWVVSLLVTAGSGTPHAKIIVEGLNDSDELYVGEFHIAEVPDNESGTMEGCGSNPIGKYLVICSERSCYKDDEKITQYKDSSSRSWRINKKRAMDIINAVAKEKQRAPEKNDYVFAGSSSAYHLLVKKGENCITWCAKKLRLGGISYRQPITDIVKASPCLHVHPIKQAVDSTQEDLYIEESSSTCSLL